MLVGQACGARLHHHCCPHTVRLLLWRWLEELSRWEIPPGGFTFGQPNVSSFFGSDVCRAKVHRYPILLPWLGAATKPGKHLLCIHSKRPADQICFLLPPDDQKGVGHILLVGQACGARFPTTPLTPPPTSPPPLHTPTHHPTERHPPPPPPLPPPCSLPQKLWWVGFSPPPPPLLSPDKPFSLFSSQ